MMDEIKIQRILLYEMFSTGQTQLNSFQIDLKNALYIGCCGDGDRVVGHAITRIYTVTYVRREVAKGLGVERVGKDKAQLARQYWPGRGRFSIHQSSSGSSADGCHQVDGSWSMILAASWGFELTARIPPKTCFLPSLWENSAASATAFILRRIHAKLMLPSSAISSVPLGMAHVCQSRRAAQAQFVGMSTCYTQDGDEQKVNRSEFLHDTSSQAFSKPPQ